MIPQFCMALLGIDSVIESLRGATDCFHQNLLKKSPIPRNLITAREKLPPFTAIAIRKSWRLPYFLAFLSAAARISFSIGWLRLFFEHGPLPQCAAYTDVSNCWNKGMDSPEHDPRRSLLMVGRRRAAKRRFGSNLVTGRIVSCRAVTQNFRQGLNFRPDDGLHELEGLCENRHYDQNSGYD